MKSQKPKTYIQSQRNFQSPTSNFFFIFSLFILLAFTFRIANAQSNSGKIEGHVVNASQGAPANSAANLTITLLAATATATTPITTTVRSDASGKFIFANLDAQTSTRYLLATQYAGIDYYSDVFSFAANQTTLPPTLTIRETTEDASAARVQQTHFIISVGARALNVAQIIIAQNATDRVYIGKPLTGPHRATLALPLLAGARNIQFSDADADATTRRDADALTYTLPFYPGSNQIVFTYDLPFTPPNYTFNLKMPFDSAQFRILLQDVGGKIQSAQLSAPAPFSAQNGEKYLLTTATNVAAQTTIHATITNLPASGAPSPRSADPNAQWIGGAVLASTALALGALLIFALTRKRTPPARQALLETLADLDDAFARGDLADADYRAERARVKQELKRETFEVSKTSKV